jgi:predicted nucleic acid-binding protein
LIAPDASVALKWVLDEDGSEAAHALLSAGELIAPAFLSVECAYVLRTQVRKGLLSPEDAATALHYLEAVRRRTVDDRDHVGAALEIGATLVTADRKFAEAVEAVPAYAPFLRRLEA